VGTAHRLSFPASLRAAQLGVIGRLTCEARFADLFLDLRARIDAGSELGVIGRLTCEARFADLFLDPRARIGAGAAG
jgi:hypothetical protein